MDWSDAEQRRAYQRGYHAGRTGGWDQTRPTPPDGLVARILDLLDDTSGAVDTLYMTAFCDDSDGDDEFGLRECQQRLAAMRDEVRDWINSRPTHPEEPR